MSGRHRNACPNDAGIAVRIDRNTQQLQAVVNQAANIVVEEMAYSSIGVNFNIAPSAVLKFDVTHADDKLTDESDVLASAAVQFVF